MGININTVKVYMECYDEIHDTWTHKWLVAEFCDKVWASWFVKRAEERIKGHARLVIDDEEAK